MKELLVSCVPALSDVIQLEPTLEALYYQHAPCKLTLRTNMGFAPLFEHHPLISKIVPFDEKDLDPEGYDEHVKIPDPSRWNAPVPTVDKFAIAAGVSLLRRTPKIFLREWPKDREIIIEAKGDNTMPEWKFDLSAQFPDLKIVSLEHPADPDELREWLDLLASALLVVGPDGWQTQAAAALDARVVIGIKPEDEALRAPFNTTVVDGTVPSIHQGVLDVLYEKRYPEFMNVGNAADHIKNHAKRYMKANFVDVGCSRWPIPNGIPVDVGNREVALEQAADGAYTGVFSSHCLEHVKDWQREMRLWHRIIRPDGYMFLYLPHPRAEVWQALTGSWVGKNHVWNPEPVTLVKFIKEELGMHIVEYTSRRDPLWSFHIIARKV